MLNLDIFRLKKNVKNDIEYKTLNEKSINDNINFNQILGIISPSRRRPWPWN